MSHLDELRRAAGSCTQCELYGPATQTVFGEGPESAWLVLVGEQPGDREDVAGRPFVGPAGRILDTALARAGIGRDEVYLTNAVKHFRFERSGNRRLHRTPTLTHLRACGNWLRDELDTIAPSAVGALGATAGKALLGPKFRITQSRGEVLRLDGRTVVATAHPSAVLRTPPEGRDAALEAMIADLRVLAGLRPS